jgi:hypothetical protein
LENWQGKLVFSLLGIDDSTISQVIPLHGIRLHGVSDFQV